MWCNGEKKKTGEKKPGGRDTKRKINALTKKTKLKINKQTWKQGK